MATVWDDSWGYRVTRATTRDASRISGTRREAERLRRPTSLTTDHSLDLGEENPVAAATILCPHAGLNPCDRTVTTSAVTG